MSQTLTRYQALFDAVQSRRRREPLPSGLDRVAAALKLRLRTGRITPAFLRRQAELIDAMAPSMRNHSDAAFNEVMRECREAIVRGRHDDEVVRRSVAAVREAARRETGQEAFIVQLMGAMALYHGRIVEMLTGEGKTLTGSLAAPLLAWRYRNLHILTVNDYLAKRDAESRAGIYRRCGLEAGAIQQEQQPIQRARIYSMPIVYGTPKQITADFLRDQIRMGPLRSAWSGRHLLGMGLANDLNAGQGGPIVPGLKAAMVDEADAVLIDEGVVPLIIAQSRRGDEMAQVYRDAASIAARLTGRTDFTMDVLRKRADLTRRGRDQAHAMIAELRDPIWRAARRAEELVRQALVARHCYINGHQYQIVDGRVVIVDEYTGRILADRSWEHGLHQAVEAKEGVEVTADRETLARLSFQRFFRSYPVLCGMTGTAADATREMERVYNHAVVVIPTNRPIARKQWPTRVFRTEAAKWVAVVDSIEEVHRQGRPVLAGTRSVEASEMLASRLRSRGLNHFVLNAVHDKEEASLIEHAGERGAITVATNMAGRGTDILLDAASKAAGGLHVVLTEMHGAKRVDRQFIGRAGRQGDPGSAQLFVSLEDEIVKLHTPRLLVAFKAMSLSLRPRGADAAPAPSDELSGRASRLAQRLFRLAQRASERRDRINRAEVLQQDDWIEQHLPGM